jgi:hypothetical protein
VLFTVACLLHDCAHAAFSHTYENYYELPQDESEFGHTPSLSKLDAEMLKEYAADQTFEKDYINCEGVAAGAAHERMSALMVSRYFREHIECIFRIINNRQSSSQFRSISVEGGDYAFIARMIIGCPYQSDRTQEYELRNCFISLLNSQTVDVDGLDYMMRDTYNSGMINQNMDYDRLLDSLRICEATRFCKAKVKDLELDGVWLQGSNIWLDKEHHEDARGNFSGQLNCKFSNKDDYHDVLHSRGKDASSSGMFACVNSGNTEQLKLSDLRSDCQVHLTKHCRVVLRHWTGELDGVICGSQPRMSVLQSLDDVSRSFVLAYGKASISVLQAAVDARNTFYQWVYTHPQVLYHSSFLQNYLLKMSAKYLCCLQRIADGLPSREGDDSHTLESEMPPRRCLKNCPLRSVAAGNRCEEDSNKNPRPLGEESVIESILGVEGFFNPLDDGSQAVCTLQGHGFWRSSDDDLNALFKWVYLHNKQRGERMNKDIDEFFGEYFSRPHHHAIWKSFGELELFKRRNPKVTVPSFDRLRGAD